MERILLPPLLFFAGIALLWIFGELLTISETLLGMAVFGAALYFLLATMYAIADEIGLTDEVTSFIRKRRGE